MKGPLILRCSTGFEFAGLLLSCHRRQGSAFGGGNFWEPRRIVVARMGECHIRNGRHCYCRRVIAGRVTGIGEEGIASMFSVFAVSYFYGSTVDHRIACGLRRKIRPSPTGRALLLRERVRHRSMRAFLGLRCTSENSVRVVVSTENGFDLLIVLRVKMVWQSERPPERCAFKASDFLLRHPVPF